MTQDAETVKRVIFGLRPMNGSNEMDNAVALIEAQSARIAELEAAIKRQAGAAKTLRQATLDEVQHLKDKDRSEYIAAATLESEREANAILTDQVERLETALTTARNDALKEAAAVAYKRLTNWVWICETNSDFARQRKASDAEVKDAILALMTKETP